MKILALFFLTFISLQNCANKVQEKFPIGITKVYHQRWVAGVRGGGSGTGFYITFEKELPNDIELNQLYFRKGVAKSHKISETEYNCLALLGMPILKMNIAIGCTFKTKGY